MFENILLLGVLGYLIWRIWTLLNRIKPKIIVKVRPLNGVEGLLLPPELGLFREMPEAGFIALMKARFAQISTAFAAGELKCIKNYMTSEVYQAFQKSVETRQKLGQIMDFKLVNFKSVLTTEMKNLQSRWVEFETEQVNLLKDKTGQVIEGDEMYLSQVKEKWQFTWNEKQGWLLSATEMVDSHAI